MPDTCIAHSRSTAKKKEPEKKPDKKKPENVKGKKEGSEKEKGEKKKEDKKKVFYSCAYLMTFTTRFTFLQCQAKPCVMVSTISQLIILHLSTNRAQTKSQKKQRKRKRRRKLQIKPHKKHLLM